MKRLWYFTKSFEVLCGLFENKQQTSYKIILKNRIHFFFGENK
jgi:hypothetical protein